MGRYTLHKHSSRLVAVLLVLLLLMGTVPSAFADGESGNLGDNLTWSLDAGTLTITGSDAMADIPEMERAPWHEFRDEIYRVVLPEGLTSIGNMAFYECEKLQSVVIPNSVTRIGRFAFAYCSDLKILNLGTGVAAIEECAFTDCYDLASLQLPRSLKTIGKKAFYRCESIPAVTVPSSVTSLGISTFGYCKSLIRADVQAQISEIPTLLFYGCERLTSVKLPDSVNTVGYHAFLDCDTLNTVYYNGHSQSPEEIQQSIGLDVPEFDTKGEVTSGTPNNSVSFGTVKEGEGGAPVLENTIVNQGQDATVSTQIQHTQADESKPGNTTTDITATITGDSGWKEVMDAVKDGLEEANEIITNTGSNAASTDITVYVQDTAIDQEFINSIAGQDVSVTMVTQDGSIWRVNGTDMEVESESDSYDLRYEVTAGSAGLCEELGTDRCFVLKFLVPAQINAEILIRLDSALSLQNATLFQRKNGDLIRHQDVIVDSQGYAHFYLASVDDKTDYYIAMNLSVPEDNAIMPQELLNEQNAIRYEPIEYKITGRTSSWGIGLGQVTLRIVIVLVLCFAVVGVVMYLLNKRKLRMGYVPELDDE